MTGPDPAAGPVRGAAGPAAGPVPGAADTGPGPAPSTAAPGAGPVPGAAAEATGPIPPGSGWPDDPATPSTPVARDAAQVRDLAAGAGTLAELVARQSVCRACPRLVEGRGAGGGGRAA